MNIRLKKRKPPEGGGKEDRPGMKGKREALDMLAGFLVFLGMAAIYIAMA